MVITLMNFVLPATPSLCVCVCVRVRARTCVCVFMIQVRFAVTFSQYPNVVDIFYCTLVFFSAAE